MLIVPENCECISYDTCAAKLSTAVLRKSEKSYG
jgi:hypothetical protein